MLDTEVLQTIQFALVEDATFSSGLWTTEEVLAYMNQRQQRFLKETKLTAATATLGWIPGVPEHDLPQDHIDTICARWHSFPEDTWWPIPQSDSFEVDHIPQFHDPSLTVFPPAAFRDSDLETLRIAIAPAPIAPGELELIYIALAETLDGTGIALEVPDEFGIYIVWGTLADMLSCEKRGQDLLRARYCEQRFEEGIALASAILDGWS